MPLNSKTVAPLGLSLLLAVASVAIYLPVRNFEFINYDDQDYVTKNPEVLSGLTWSGVRWAFTEGHAANWHPLTWLSHMADCTVFGLNAGGHHLINVVFHTANGILLFLLFWYLTGAIWRSFLVGALFALHPLHVESAAWIAERKDVLSTFFGLVCLLAYARYVRELERGSSDGESGAKPSGSDTNAQATPTHRTRPAVWYGTALLLFALGLMSKPMLVTWPCVMLLLDYWPLKRFSFGAARSSSRTALVVEKLPFAAFSAGSCVVTLLVQRAGGAMAALAPFPLTARLANSVVAYIRYLGKVLWPTKLAVIYPLSHWSAATVLGCVAILAGLSLLALWQRTRRPYLFVGWAWYIGTLVPVIGLVQVGSQSMADRYTYVTTIGLFLALAWGLAEIVGQSRIEKLVAGAGAAALLCACALASRSQIAYWQNSALLFQHALNVTANNFIAANQLGMYWADHHDLATAERYYREALASNPGFAESWNNLGCLRVEQGDEEQAVTYFREALRNEPRLAQAHNSLGTALAKQGKVEEAIAQYSEALKIWPNYAEARFNLGNALGAKGNLQDAVTQYRMALEANPAWADTHNNLGFVLAKQGNLADALFEFRTALRLQPELWQAHYGAAEILATQGKASEAAAEFLALAEAYASQGKFRQATASAKRAQDLAVAAGDKLLTDRAAGRQADYEAQARQAH